MTNCRENSAAIYVPRERTVRKGVVYRAVKRFFDLALALPAVILLAVPMLVIALVIRLDSPGAAIFKQYRVGRGGKLFSICKFRTMYTSAPSETATGELVGAYSYITRVGRFLRKTSLDELPQLFNVIKGDMSLIGPRPLIVGESSIHSLREASGVYDVRPGMTGWAQINGRDCISLNEKVALDAEYVRKLSFAFDMKVILRTIRVVLSGEGFAEGSTCVESDLPAETEKDAA